MELFHFDIETAGQYKDYESFLLEDDRGAKLFESKYKKLEEYFEVNKSVASNWRKNSFPERRLKEFSFLV